MVKKKWERVKWFGLPSFRYLFLVLPNGQRVIIDYWCSFRLLHYIPFVSRYEKFDAYFIPSSSDISEWEHFLVSEYDMVWGAAKVSGTVFLSKILGGGVISAGIIGLFALVDKPLVSILKFLHVPPFVFIVFISLLFWWAINIIAKKSIKKKIPIDQFEFRKKIIGIKFKDFMMSITKVGYTIFIIFLLIIVGTNYSNPMIVGLILLTFLAFFLNGGILRTADVYIKYEEEKENEKRE
jgi:hypothetical protein